jgi:hypothetical protein
MTVLLETFVTRCKNVLVEKDDSRNTLLVLLAIVANNLTTFRPKILS